MKITKDTTNRGSPLLWWLSDIARAHDATSLNRLKQFWENRITEEKPNVILVTGGIGPPSIHKQMLCFLGHGVLPRSTLGFVLSQKDYGHGSIASTVSELNKICGREETTRWLGRGGYCSLSTSVAMVGSDSFADFSYGNPTIDMKLSLDKFRMLSEYANLGFDDLLEAVRSQGKKAAEDLYCAVSMACRQHSEIIILSATPNFPELFTQNNLLDTEKLCPRLAYQVGEVIRVLANENPQNKFFVLCGAVGPSTEVQISANLFAMSAGSVSNRIPVQRWSLLNHDLSWCRPVLFNRICCKDCNTVLGDPFDPEPAPISNCACGKLWIDRPNSFLKRMGDLSLCEELSEYEDGGKVATSNGFCSSLYIPSYIPRARREG